MLPESRGRATPRGGEIEGTPGFSLILPCSPPELPPSNLTGSQCKGAGNAVCRAAALQHKAEQGRGGQSLRVQTGRCPGRGHGLPTAGQGGALGRVLWPVVFPPTAGGCCDDSGGRFVYASAEVLCSVRQRHRCLPGASESDSSGCTNGKGVSGDIQGMNKLVYSPGPAGPPSTPGHGCPAWLCWPGVPGPVCVQVRVHTDTPSADRKLRQCCDSKGPAWPWQQAGAETNTLN